MNINRIFQRGRLLLLLPFVFIAVPLQSVEAQEQVYVIPFKGEVESGLYRFLVRAANEAKEAEAKAIIIEMDTPGGRVDSALEIADLFMSSQVPVHVLVTNTAASAGAIISLAAESILMEEGATIGFAAPVMVGGAEPSETIEQKTLSYVLAQVRAISEKQGFSKEKTRIAEAMVDKDIEIENPNNPGEYITREGKLLGLTAEEAKRLDFIAAVVKDRDDALRHLGHANAQVVYVEEEYAEKVARFFTGSVIAGMLLTIGIIGILVEIRTPGFGVPGIIGLLAVALFFWGHMIAGLAGWEGLILFSLGVILLAVEIFIIPGFGVAGIGGILCIVASLVITLMDQSFTSPHFPATFQWEGLVDSIVITLFALMIGTSVALILPLMFPFFAQSRYGSWLSLMESEESAMGYQSAPEENRNFLGKSGISLSTLRPVGIAEIEGKRVDVVSQGSFIPPQTPVVVVKVEGSRIVVVRSA